MNSNPKKVNVYSKEGHLLAPCSWQRARQMLRRGKAVKTGPTSVQLVLGRGDEKQIRKEVLERDHYRCYITEKVLAPHEATVDHIRSRAKGGSDFAENLACCSQAHNLKKGQLDLEDYISFLISNPATEEELRVRLEERFPYLVTTR